MYIQEIPSKSVQTIVSVILESQPLLSNIITVNRISKGALAKFDRTLFHRAEVE